ncbi:MAG TPA: response regulator [Bacteroidia bacterium]|jgi:two-component SAPR family response regulator
MNKMGPVIVIEDNKADQRILVEIFKNIRLENELQFFSDGVEALEFLNSTEKIPFLIISDINMPKINGFELRKKIQENQELSLKCVPFLFFSTGADRTSVADAYSMSVQGFFRKPLEMDKLENTMKKIIEYWKECVAPSDYNE